jgi:hypothetical protein
LNHKAQNLFYTGSERNSRNQQICLPTLYLRVVFSFNRYLQTFVLRPTEAYV